jgi:hypothetical protein
LIITKVLCFVVDRSVSLSYDLNNVKSVGQLDATRRIAEIDLNSPPTCVLHSPVYSGVHFSPVLTWVELCGRVQSPQCGARVIRFVNRRSGTAGCRFEQCGHYSPRVR